MLFSNVVLPTSDSLDGSRDGLGNILTMRHERSSSGAAYPAGDDRP
jgi:hypothetical protein